MSIKTVRLEELLRLTIIAMISVLLGIMVLFVSAPHQSRSVADESAILVFVFAALGIFVVGFPLALVIGFALHLVIRSRVLPRIFLLPIFVIFSCLVGAFVVHRQWPGFLPLTVGTGCVAWFLYSFGPLRLWRFEFVPEEHSDF